MPGQHVSGSNLVLFGGKRIAVVVLFGVARLYGYSYRNDSERTDFARYRNEFVVVRRNNVACRVYDFQRLEFVVYRTLERNRRKRYRRGMPGKERGRIVIKRRGKRRAVKVFGRAFARIPDLNRRNRKRAVFVRNLVIRGKIGCLSRIGVGINTYRDFVFDRADVGNRIKEVYLRALIRRKYGTERGICGRSYGIRFV